MNSMMRLVAGVVLVFGLGSGLWGCGDDDDLGPEEFQVTITVRDTLWNPVEGLELTLIPDMPVFQDKCTADVDPIPVTDKLFPCFPNPFNPVTRIHFQVNPTGYVVVNVLDVEKDVVMTMMADQLVAGEHQIIWDSQNIQDEVQPGGVYYAQVEYYSHEGGELRYTAEEPMLLANWGMNGPPVATTDADGKVVLKDKRLFPFLYDIEPFDAMNENGEAYGVIDCTSKMRFYLTDRSGARTLRFDRDVSSGDEYNFLWE